VLDSLEHAAVTNGVHSLARLSQADVNELEPNVRCEAALLSPETGIVDVHELMLSLLGEAEYAGATLCLQSPVTGGALGDAARAAARAAGVEDAKVAAIVESGDTRLACHTLVNCSGLSSVAVAHMLQAPHPLPSMYFAKGNYFTSHVGGAHSKPFSRLVYPVPEKHGLGVHATLDLAGRVTYGPDVQWQEESDMFDVDTNRAALFEKEVRKYYPALPEGSLVPAYAGIRPKLSRTHAQDFTFLTHPVTGPSVLHLLGIESPGLTSSLSIADRAVDMLSRSAL
jgi:L-2-hydroxyglutarate oxidase LhgO